MPRPPQVSDPPPGGDDESTTGMIERVAQARPAEDLEDARVKAAVRARVFGGTSQPLRIDRFTLLERVGEGGAGEVWAAYDPRLDRKVALKLLRVRPGGSTVAADRLLREAQVPGRLSHPNIVAVFDVSQFDERAYLTMEFIEGPNLARWLADAERSAEAIVDVFTQAGRGLVEAHRNGVVHRDFKPANVMLRETSGRMVAKVVDFGLAGWLPSDTADSVPDSVDGASGPGLTRTGQCLGTPAYMAPEQRAGETLDGRSDQFSFCVSLFEALAGQRPFDRVGVYVVQPGVMELIPTRRVREALERGLSVDPDARWPTMEALLSELDEARRRRSRRGLHFGVAALMLIGSGVATSLYADVAQRCEGAAAEMGELWSEARRDTLRTAVLGTNRSYAESTWVRVEASLDAYAVEWAAKHRQICEATSVRHEQSSEVMDLRMACLQRRKVELQQALVVLAGTRDDTLANAARLAASLSPLSVCDDAQALAATVAPPKDPDVARRVEVQREQLALVEQLQRSGDYDGALAAVQPIVGEAAGLAYLPLQAEAWLRRGAIQQLVADYPEAERDLLLAYSVAAQHGLEDIEVHAVSLLAWVVGGGQAKFDSGLQWGVTALALSAGGDGLTRSRALNHVGNVHRAQGNAAQALDHYERALAIIGQSRGKRHANYAVVLENIGNVLDELGKYDEALEYLHRALEIQEETSGVTHPVVGRALNGICAVLAHQGQFGRALEYCERGLAVTQAALGEDHVETTMMLGNIGVMLANQGKYDEAVEYQRRALDARERTLGPAHNSVATSHVQLGILLKNQGKLDEALGHQQTARAILEATPGSPPAMLAHCLAAIGTVLRMQGKGEEALAHQRQALGLWEEALGPRHANVAVALGNIGNGLFGQGKHDEAAEFFVRALDVWEEAVGRDHPSFVHTQANFARLLRAQGKLAQARALYDVVLAAVMRRDEPRTVHVAEALLDVAETARRDDDFAAARDHAQRAVDLAADLPLVRARARFILADALWAEPAERSRARALAAKARATYDDAGDSRVAKVDAWLSEHRKR